MNLARVKLIFRIILSLMVVIVIIVPWISAIFIICSKFFVLWIPIVIVYQFFRFILNQETKFYETICGCIMSYILILLLPLVILLFFVIGENPFKVRRYR